LVGGRTATRLLGPGSWARGYYILPYVRAGKCWPAQHTLLPDTSIWFPSSREIMLDCTSFFAQHEQEAPRDYCTHHPPLIPYPLNKLASIAGCMSMGEPSVVNCSVGAPWRRPVQRRAMPRFKECNATLSFVLKWINDAPPHNCGAIGQPSHTTSSFLESQLLTIRPRHGLTGLEIELFHSVQAVIEVNLVM